MGAAPDDHPADGQLTIILVLWKTTNIQDKFFILKET